MMNTFGDYNGVFRIENDEWGIYRQLQSENIIGTIRVLPVIRTFSVCILFALIFNLFKPHGGFCTRGLFRRLSVYQYHLIHKFQI